MTKPAKQHTITDIKPQTKQPNRYSIFLDGKFWCGVSSDALLDSKLAKGDTLSEDEASQLKQVAKVDKINNRVLQWVAIRPRSEWEVRQYLQRNEIATDLQDILMKKLKKLSLVDDKAFAKAWVANRRLLKSISKRKLQAELRQKRINDEIVTSILSQDEVDDLVAIKDIILVKRRQGRYQDDNKLMQYLARQGFHYGDIKAAMEEATN